MCDVLQDKDRHPVYYPVPVNICKPIQDLQHKRFYVARCQLNMTFVPAGRDLDIASQHFMGLLYNLLELCRHKVQHKVYVRIVGKHISYLQIEGVKLQCDSSETIPLSHVGDEALAAFSSRESQTS